MNKMIVINILFIIMMLPAVSGATEPGVVLQEYLELDAKGARLREWQSEKYLANWEGEPGWDEVTIITDYSIQAGECSGERCTYRVMYSLYPTKEEPQVAADPQGGKETLTYNMRKRKGQWFLEDFIQPHVFVDAYRRITGNR